MAYPSVTAITCTYNRHEHLERVVKCFLDQDYKGDHFLLIYNNNPIEQRLENVKLPSNKRIIVVNNHKDLQTHKPYTNLGAIYRDALTFVPTNTDVLCFTDDDDSYLPNHISEGVHGLQRAQDISTTFKAYKPKYSWFRDAQWNTVKASNVFEPSIFVLASHVFKYGFKETTADQHYSWYIPLIEEGSLYIDPEGPSTLIYNWMGDVWKTSGNPSDPNNWKFCRQFEGSTGDGIITPVTDEQIAPYYKV